ncbi:MAG TPA: tetratricopeptide repeat protein, partial [Actinomycetes bacterium]|nr:tetratricopeptide repeat protein [Actinomycetes bacterium]
NLIAAATAAATDPDHREIAWLLADALRRYSWIRADAIGWLALAEAGLVAATAAGNAHGRASAELGLGLADIQAGRYEDGIAHLRRAIAFSRRAGWEDCQAVSYGNLGIAHSELGHLRLAIDHFGKALALNEQLDRRGGLATNLGNLGLLQLRMGRFGPAADQLVRALTLQSDGAGRGNRGVFLTGLGTAKAHLGQVGTALDDLLESVTICAEFGDATDQVEVQCSLARLYAQLGRHADAAHCAEAAVERSQPSTAANQALALTARATTRLAAGQHEPGLADSRSAVGLIDGGVGQYVQLVVMLGLAAAEQCTGQYDEARDRATRVADTAKVTGYRHLHGQALSTIAASYLGAGMDSMAARYGRQALAIQRRDEDRLSQAATLSLLARVLPDGDQTIRQLRAAAPFA